LRVLAARVVVGERKNRFVEERERFTMAVLPLMRIWVRGEAEPPYVGGGERFLWGLQGLKKQQGEREKRETLAGRKTGE
jgi:hypothetical protein